MKTHLILIHFLLLFAFTSCSKEKYNKPNIIILYADDMGFGDLAIENVNSKIPTPNLDKLASEGLLMTDAHSSSGICTPSRYALLTGRYHWRDFHDIVKSMEGSVFKEEQLTLPGLMKSNGYATAAIGKWHLGWDWEAIRKKNFLNKEKSVLRGKEIEIWPSEAYDWSKSIPHGPLSIGFDYYFGDGTINFPPYVWIENDKVTETPTTTMVHPKGVSLEGNWELRPGPAVKNWNLFDVLPTLTKKAVSYIENRKEQKTPFFLYMAFPSPHAPIIPNKEFRGKSEAGPYGDYVNQTDWCVGQILEALEAIGATDNTIVIFSSDNGPEHYAYDRITKYNHASNAPFRGLKRDIYEGGHHVPFIVRWPNKIKPGTKSKAIFNQIDILKTLSSLTGSQLPKGFKNDSYDFSNLWLGDDKNFTGRPSMVHNTHASKYALRKENWLYINNANGYHSRTPEWEDDMYEKTNDTVQLFNLKSDVSQKANVASLYPEIVKSMQLELNKVRENETFIE